MAYNGTVTRRRVARAAATQHKVDCRMIFGRKDPDCPRCQELMNGAPAVKWRSSRMSIDAQRCRDHKRFESNGGED